MQRLALVTGAAGVVGKAIAAELLQKGHRVVLADLELEKTTAIARELGEHAHPIAFDVGNSTAVSEACREIRARWGNIEILVNNAGILSNHKVADTTPEEWRRVTQVNLDSAFFLTREWLPEMKARRWGRIVNIASLAGKVGGITAGTAYSTSKGGMLALTIAVARESAPFGVTINSISPAYVKTPMVTVQLSEEQRQKVLASIPVGRFCEPDEVAYAVAFLVSDRAGFITGENMDMNGGLYFD